MKRYNLSCLLPASLEEKDLEKIIENIKQVLEKNSAENIVFSGSSKIKLSYEIKKNDLASFAHISFDISPDSIVKVKKDLAVMPAVLRSIIVAVKGADNSIPVPEKPKVKKTVKPVENKKEAKKTTKSKAIKKTVKKTVISKKPAVKKTVKDKIVKKETKETESTEEERIKQLDAKLDELLKD